ncbi:hypothetical protein BJ508DRAFT_409916 [Ascobolus immersus RN42]|uniref:ORC6 first cyclin-like domain-containing protein n=1 Tax=Ascobolus immersus RN42 TaxID=1160509 RepID=A0A3N4IQC7_ASCIM|nr:hypothetical protein BJ508DRAFT_409916 [Ascobolus immersus RN42]
MASSAHFEQTILSIIPTATSDIPEKLIATARALFVQSKQKIVSLKPTEEPARIYICCHIACERLRAKLDLPPVKATRPPVPKRTYTNLYKYFDEALIDAPVRNRGRPAANAKSKVPKDIQAAIHNLCEKLDTPKAEQHVIAGIDYVLGTLKGDQDEDDLVGWIVLAYVVTITKLDPKTRTDADKKRLVRNTIEGLGKLGNGIGQTRALALTAKYEDEAQDWKWVQNIPLGGGTGGTVKGAKKRKRQTGESGIGRMIQDRVDFLSERRIANFEQWREMILAQVVAAEREALGHESNPTQQRSVVEAN